MDIAIVGMGCRFPGGINSADQYWDALVNHRSFFREVPDDRWNLHRFSNPAHRADRIVSRYGGFVEGIAEFDAGFFGLSRREAQAMDPQQRLFLEASYDALEDAMLNPTGLSNQPVGVFVGASSHDYWDLQQRSSSSDMYTNTGKASSIIANRLSYLFHFRGPSLVVDTACSSSLVALHLAYRSLVDGESSVAIVGGVNVILNPNLSIGFSQAGMLSSEPMLKAFDRSGKGYVRSEGVGVVVLMPVDAARRQGLRICAVVKGTMINQDGRTRGLSQPSELAQRELLSRLYERLAVVPSTLGYVEAHGTGTAVGDRIELSALATLGMMRKRAGEGPLKIGSVKTNFGHLESAAGIAGLMKVALCLRERAWVGSLNFERAPEGVDLAASHLAIAKSVERWSGTVDMFAGVNSFGFGGTNAHAVLAAPSPLEESVASVKTQATVLDVRGAGSEGYLAFPVTGQSLKSLGQRLQQVKDIASGMGRDALAGLSTSLRNCYRFCQWRVLVWARTSEELCEAIVLRQAEIEAQERERLAHTARLGDRKYHPLVDLKAGRNTAQTVENTYREAREGVQRTGVSEHVGAVSTVALRPVFVFSGQGGQWLAMGKALLSHCSASRAVVEECDRLFSVHAGWSIVELLESEHPTVDVAETQYAQPLLFALQVALVAFWKSLGVTPQAVLGHSVGEVAAAYTAGVYSLEDAIKIVYVRSTLQQRTRKDMGMVAVQLRAEEFASRFAGYEVAAINGPTSITVGGTKADLAELTERLDRAGVFYRTLEVRHAFHTSAMDEIESSLREQLREIRPQRAAIALYSTVSGHESDGLEWDQSYWWANVRECVRFYDAVQALKQAEATRGAAVLWLELSAQPTFRRAIEETYGDSGGCQYQASLRKGGSEQDVRETIERAFLLGVSMAWDRGERSDLLKLPKLPPYPWDRERYWQEPIASRNHRLSVVNHPWLSLINATPTDWTMDLTTSSHPMLADHRVHDAAVFPAAGYMDLVLAMPVAGRSEPKVIEGLQLKRAFHVALESDVSLRLSYEPDSKVFTFASVQANQRYPVVHCTGKLKALVHPVVPKGLRIEEAREGYGGRVTAEEIYGRFAQIGLQYGPAFQGICEAYAKHNEALAKICVAAVDDEARTAHPFHPSYLDSCFQAALLTIEHEQFSAEKMVTVLPVVVKAFEMYAQPTAVCWVKVNRTLQTAGQFEADLTIYADDGQAIGRVFGFRCVVLQEPSPTRFRQVQYESVWRAVTSLPASGDGVHAGPVSASEERAGASTASEAAGVRSERELRSILLVCDDVAVRAGFVRALGQAQKVVAVGRDELLRDGTLAELETRQGAMGTIVWIAARAQQEAGPESVRELGDWMRTVQAVGGRPRRVVLVTEGSQDVSTGDRLPGAAAAMLWGFARVAANEQSQCTWRLVDMDDVRTVSAEQLAEVLSDRSAETEWAVREGRLYVGRLQESVLAAVAGQAKATSVVDTGRDAVHLVRRDGSTVESVVLAKGVRRSPGPKEVEIKVRASAINFRDVMKVLGIYPSENPRDVFLGDECSGVVSEAGAESGFAVGDEVLAFAPSAFATYVTTGAELVFGKPAQLSYGHAAGFGVAHVTAYYGLQHLARLAPSESVLIHGAAGGVGLAAVAIAKALGAEIYATAGSEEKREYLRSLGVRAVFDSRRLAFVEELRAQTGGRGVDVVLNSIAGEALEKSFAVLAPFGRFVEIGKVDIFRNSALGLELFKHNISLFAVDLVELLQHKPQLVRAMMNELLAWVRAEKIAAPRTQEYALTAHVEALRSVAQSKQIGKVVLTVGDDGPLEVFETESPNLSLKADGTYVVTGGTRGFGFATARWLVEQGAKHLVLLGKTGDVSASVREEIAWISAQGVACVVMPCDVSDSEAVRVALERVRATMPRIRGVFHAAMVLDDAPIEALTNERLASVLGPKALGAWNLHQATQPDALEHFVVYSSVAAEIGNPGQANYVAANCYLDALASMRRAKGLPGLSVAWGVIGETGYVSRNPVVKRHLQSFGLQAMAPKRALSVLQRLVTQGVARQVVADVQWQQVAVHAAALVRQPRLHGCYTEYLLKHNIEHALLDRLSMLTPEERRKQIANRILIHVADILRVQLQAVSLETRLQDLGVDSLAVLDLKNRLYNDVRVSLQATDFSSQQTIGALVELVDHKLDQPR